MTISYINIIETPTHMRTNSYKIKVEEDKSTYAFTGSKGCTAYCGVVVALLTIFWVSYNKNMPNNTSPP